MKSGKTRRIGVSFLSRGGFVKYTHIIWDFNGTLLNDVDIGIQSINVLLAARGMAELPSADAYREVSGFPIIEYYKRIGFDFSEEPYDKVALEWVEQYTSRMGNATLYDGAEELLGLVRKMGMGQILLSATELDMLRTQVDSLGIGRFFDEICGMDNVYAHGKKSLGQKWAREHMDARALFVGDTDHDFEVASEMGADCVLFSGGHQSYARLSQLGCPVVRHLSELKNYIL